MTDSVKVHWLHSKGLEAIFALRMTPSRESICIDKDPLAEAILRSALDKLGIEPLDGLRVHLWKLQIANRLHYFFIDDEQNNLVKQGFATACKV